MECAKCGALLGPGVRECPDCGNQVYGNDYVYAAITVSWEEARKGGLHAVEMRNLMNPLKVRIKPGTRAGDKVRVPGAMFCMEDESVLLAPVEVTVHVERRPVWQTVMAVMLCLLLAAGMGAGIWAAVEHLEGQPAQQVSSTVPTQPQQTTAPSAVPTTQPVETQETTGPENGEPETTEPGASEPGTTEPETTEPQQSGSIIMNFEMRPLLQQLSDEDLANLEAMYQAAMNFESTTTLPYEITVEKLEYLAALLNAECPELMQLNITTGYTYNYDPVTNIVSSYEYVPSMTQAEYKNMYDAVVAVVEELVAQTDGMTDWEKERFVFEHITSNCSYDMYTQWAGTAYGTLVEGVAKCDGISLATKWILEEMGVVCIMVTGDPTVGDVGHAWNYIMLDGEYYGLDVTADVRRADDACPVLYCAYNVTTDMVDQNYILRGAFAEFVNTPTVTNVEKSYHAENGSYVAAGDDWRSKAGADFVDAYTDDHIFFLQFESQSQFEECVAELDQVLTDAFQDSGLTGTVSWVTWQIIEHNVLRVELTIE